jgi:hypothetical protein
MLYLKSKNQKSNRFLIGIALAVMLFSSIQINPNPAIKTSEACFLNIFKLEIFGVLDGIKHNTEVDFYLFGKKIF